MMGGGPISPDEKPSIKISPHLELQPPLSRRGIGPGLILVLDHYALLEQSEKHLDPPPLTKWAEEGFAVAQILVPGKTEDGGEFPLEKAIEALKDLKECDVEGGFGMICIATLSFPSSLYGREELLGGDERNGMT
jgi:carboxymethylenebutenolidase